MSRLDFLTFGNLIARGRLWPMLLFLFFFGGGGGGGLSCKISNIFIKEWSTTLLWNEYDGPYAPDEESSLETSKFYHNWTL
jgi:hypothetical protein